MRLLLNWRVWVFVALVAFLAFTHLTAYRHGKQNVKSEWLASVAAANADARKLEQRRQDMATEAANLAAKRELAIRSDAARARSESSGVRSDLLAIQQSSSESLTAANNAVRALSDVFGSCVAAYTELAEQADRADSEARELRQAWPK